MPIVISIFVLPPFIALFAARKASGKKRLLAWGIFALLVLPLLIAGGGGWLLSRSGLAWRSCVKLPCGLAFVAGVLALLLWGAIALAKRLEAWRPVAGPLLACAVVPAAALLCIVVGWYGLLFTAIWSGGDREVTVRGERMVMEQAWMDQDYYAYHGPLTRGSRRIYGSWELDRDDFEEAGPWT